MKVNIFGGCRLFAPGMPGLLRSYMWVIAHRALEWAYEKYLCRASDRSGLNFWITQMQNGLTDEHLESAFIGSDEFFQHAGGTNKAWVWVNQFAMAFTNEVLIAGFIASDEYFNNAICA